MLKDGRLISGKRLEGRGEKKSQDMEAKTSDSTEVDLKEPAVGVLRFEESKYLSTSPGLLNRGGSRCLPQLLPRRVRREVVAIFPPQRRTVPP